jgi:hypothetical protein
MSGYTVTWLRDAERELANIWVQAHDRQAVTRAQAQIDVQLERDPFHFGTVVAEGLHKLVVPPLMVFFAVDSARRHVEVSWVASTR